MNASARPLVPRVATVLAIVISLVLIAPLSHGGEPAKTAVKQKTGKPAKAKKPAKETVVLTTGTHIGQKVQRTGKRNDGINNVITYTGEDIRKSGRGSVTDYLRTQPIFR